MGELVQLLCVHVDGDCYGIETEYVQEVLRDTETTPVPLSPASVVGLINLRGQIVVTMSLRRLLGRQDDHDHPCGSLIVKAGHETINILVDRVEDVVTLPSDQLVMIESMKGETSSLLKNVYKTADRLIHVLDATSLMDQMTSQN